MPVRKGQAHVDHRKPDEPPIAAPERGLLNEAIGPSAKPSLPSGSRLIRAAVYRSEKDAPLVGAGDALVDLLDAIVDPVKTGPMQEEPRLVLRNRKNAKGRALKPIIVIQHCEITKSTKVQVDFHEDITTNVKALAKLADYNFRRRIDVYAARFGHAVTVADVVDEFLEDREPQTAAMRKAFGKRYDIICNDGEQLIEIIGDRLLGDADFTNVGFDYANGRTGMRKGNQSPNNPDRKNVQLKTATGHLKSLRQMLRHHADKWNRAVRTFVMPKVQKTGVKWLNWYQLMQLLLACRGYLFDSAGNLLRDQQTRPDGTTKWVPRRLPRDEWKEFGMVERFIILYLFGIRHTKNKEMRWHHSEDFGYIDLVNRVLVRSGQNAPITNKGALPSKLLGSLERFARKWKRDDDAAGTPYIVHHADGSMRRTSLAKPFAKVATNAGLKGVTPHDLKHTGVTLMAYAGMPAPALAEAFSTTLKTLFAYYTHLTPVWTHGSTAAWSPENACLLNLKRVSPLPAGYPRVGGKLPE